MRLWVLGFRRGCEPMAGGGWIGGWPRGKDVMVGWLAKVQGD